MAENESMELATLKGRFEGLVRSEERYPIDFDDAWQWVGYSRKDHALEVLLKDFEEGQDFSRILGKSTGGRPAENYFLTIDCFKSFCMMAGTERGKEVRRYYLAVEKAFVEAREKIPALQARLEERLARIEAAVLAPPPVRYEDPEERAFAEVRRFLAENIDVTGRKDSRVWLHDLARRFEETSGRRIDQNALWYALKRTGLNNVRAIGTKLGLKRLEGCVLRRDAGR